ncbi:uncharacterized protein LOC118644657 [Monomorium pharaonis]|uniref:uncharacterized protein LOC118644657 n=1 Tax=Monomorium pharaonis TaxID=307658 RepID=UPI001745D6FD|nr:uncharacterized protein LOC118644657 [Monomorium pharaonis]
MVLISTENLERMQRQQQQQLSVELMENSLLQSSGNITGDNNSVQTPGTPLTRLDAEMSRHASEKPFGVRTKPLATIREEEDEGDADDNDDDNDYDDDDDSTIVFHETSPISGKHPRTSDIDTVKEKTRKVIRNIHVLKSVEKILETVPKTYRTQARMLMRHLQDEAVPDRLNWDEKGIVTIDGNVVKDSDITELINDAVRERKTVNATGRDQFARLLRSLNTRTALVGNKELLKAVYGSSINARPQSLASSTPNITRSPPKRRLLNWSTVKKQ